MTRDRDTIREWADEHDLVPVRRREGEQSTTRFVPRSEAEDTDHMDWEEFHTELGESDRVVVYDESREGHPIDVTDRESAISRSNLDDDEIEEMLVGGEVVTGEITETKVVETTVVEQAELVSELVDTEIVDEQVTDVELLSRECSSCDLVGTSGTDETGWFDTDHYLESRTTEGTMTGPGVDVGTAPYTAELDVEERYRVTREFTERFTIETRVEDTDVSGTDRVVADDIDVEGLQQSIVESDLFRMEGDTDVDVDVDADMESEFAEDDRVHTYVDRKRTAEEELRDRKRLRTEITDVSDHELELVEASGAETMTDLESRTIEHGGAMEGTTTGAEMDETTGERPMDATADEPTTGTTAEAHTTGTGVDETRGTTADEGEYRTTLTEDDEGKDVVDATGDEVGMVVQVDETEGIAHVDPHPGIAERIKAKLDMGDADDDAFRLRENRISRIGGDFVQMDEAEDIDADEMT